MSKPPEKGQYGLECYRSACKTAPAHWFNHSTRMYYCEECATLINEMNPEGKKIFGHELCTIVDMVVPKQTPPGAFDGPIVDTHYMDEHPQFAIVDVNINVHEEIKMWMDRKESTMQKLFEMVGIPKERMGNPEPISATNDLMRSQMIGRINRQGFEIAEPPVFFLLDTKGFDSWDRFSKPKKKSFKKKSRYRYFRKK